MKRKHLFVLTILLSLCLSGCNKDIDSTISSIDFGESESTKENTEENFDNFKIEGDFGGYFDSKETTKSQKQIEKENLKEKESLEEIISSIENQKSEVLNTDKVDSINSEYNNISIEYLEELNDGLVLSMKQQIYNGEILQKDMDTIKDFIDDNFDETDNVKIAIKDYLNDCWKDYLSIQESLASLPPEETWNFDELKKNPDLKNYSRSEYEFIQKIGEEHGVKTIENFDWGQ